MAVTVALATAAAAAAAGPRAVSPAVAPAASRNDSNVTYTRTPNKHEQLQKLHGGSTLPNSHLSHLR